MSLYNEDEDGEFVSHRKVQFSRQIEILMKSFTGRIQGAHTLGALLTIRHDIERSPIKPNLPAKEEMRRLANRHAIEIGFKPAREGEKWWN